MRMDGKSGNALHADPSEKDLENGKDGMNSASRKRIGQNGSAEKNALENDAESDEELGDVEFPCGICNKEVNDNDEAILCESGCSYWYHRTCTSMTLQAYQMLTNEDNAEWVCDKCIATRSIPAVKLKY